MFPEAGVADFFPGQRFQKTKVNIHRLKIGGMIVRSDVM